MGGVPSNAHLRDSYFDRMKDSILLFESQNLGVVDGQNHTVQEERGPV